MKNCEKLCFSKLAKNLPPNHRTFLKTSSYICVLHSILAEVKKDIQLCLCNSPYKTLFQLHVYYPTGSWNPPQYKGMFQVGLYQAKPRRYKLIELIYIIQVFWPYVDITYRFGFFKSNIKKINKIEKSVLVFLTFHFYFILLITNSSSFLYQSVKHFHQMVS